MESSISPPLSPTARMSPLDTTTPSSAEHFPHTTSPRQPQEQQQQHRRRRSTASFSSMHHQQQQDRSPQSQRNSRHRFSNASQESFLAGLRDDEDGEIGAAGTAGADRGGNLADELDFVSDDEGEEFLEEGGEDEEALINPAEERGKKEQEQAVKEAIDGARDSGIDVSYEEKRRRGTVSSTAARGREDEGDDADSADRLSPEIEELTTAVARMAATSPLAAEDPLISRTLTLLQDLGNQSGIEAGAQRLTTSTNSLTSHLLTQTRAVQTLATSLYSPFGAIFNAPLDHDILIELIPLVETLLQDLPHPDPHPLHGLQKLDRDTTGVVTVLSQLTDTLQMGKQQTNAASRHLRNTEAVVVELRREHERADAARLDLRSDEWPDRFAARWCETECQDILDGFSRTCDSLREGLVADVAAAAGTATAA